MVRKPARAGTPVPPLFVLEIECNGSTSADGKLPHYQPDNKAFFITFCAAKRWTLPERARDIVVEVCVYGNGTPFRLHGLVVMPDHVHLVLTPLADADGAFTIADIMQIVKSRSAHRIHKLLRRVGKVWQDEWFDRALRCEGDIGNPVGAGLVFDPLDYPWIWRETGV